MRINPTPQHLLCFLRVAETGSFSAAARLLAMSQPALSRTIRLLEEQIGVRLFDRDTRNVALTAVGRELRPVAERLTGDYAHAFGAFAQLVAGQRGRITVAALPSLAASVLAPAIATLRAERAGCRRADPGWPVRHGDLDAVASGRAEIGLTVQPAANPALVYKPLLADAVGLVCRADDRLAASEALPWAVFKGARFIAMAQASSVRMLTDAAFLQAGAGHPAAV